jgi:hypothetical protein
MYPDMEQTTMHILSSHSRLLISGLVLLFLGYNIVAELAEHTPARMAARVCAGDALMAFFNAYPAYGGYEVHAIHTDIIASEPNIYRVESQVEITTGGFKNDKFDDYPIKRYTARYSCLATRHGFGFWKSDWSSQITSISSLSPPYSEQDCPFLVFTACRGKR